MEILKDNKTSFTLSKKPKSHNYIKNIDKINDHIGKLVDNRELTIE